ncbi:MAG: InlB B-repeat-containing protein, partial [Clostridia bacterium]|nr:InlB B-repeat-containing protein [Clostridia bacterium]
TRSEYNKAIDNVNTSLNSSLGTIIEQIFSERKYNNADEKEKKENPETTEYKVKFNSGKGSAVEEQTVIKNNTATEPTAPTYEGYAFYGWYTDDTFETKYDFDTPVTANITLYAKWVETRAARPIWAKEEVDDYDPDDDSESIVEEIRFFSNEYTAKLKSKEIELDVNVNIDDEDWADYIDDGIARVKKNIGELYRDYDYFLDSEMKTLLITKLERYIGKSVSVSEDDVKARWELLVAENKEAFNASETAFESALTSALTTTYFQKVTVDENNSGYGFVANILLKMDQKDVDELVAAMDTVTNKDILKSIRDKKLQELVIHVSNPDYDPAEDVDYNNDGVINKADKEIADEIVDAMTDERNPYNGLSGAEFANKFNAENDYTKLISLEKNAETGKWEIKYGAVECPSMAYLLDTVPAFGTDGIVEQMFNSFESVKAAVSASEMTHIEGLYWMPQLATAWAYLVGDDSGMTSSESNNNGLGYLISPDGKHSNYIASFTEQARALIKQGAGAYTVDGTVDGSYVFGDSFIDSDTTNNAYAGVFILVCTYKAWDDTAYTLVDNGDGTYAEGEQVVLTQDANGSGVLPLDYIITYGETLEDCVTVGGQIKSDLETGMKSDAYNLKTNTFGVDYTKNIKYSEKVYKSLWKDLD